MSDKIKTLGQAIRYGSTLKPHWRGAMIHEGKTCAIGAALDALGLLGKSFAEDRLRESLQIDNTRMFQHPVGPVGEGACLRSLFEIIVSLNDTYDWSREKISYWVDSVLDQREKSSSFVITDAERSKPKE